MNIDPRGYSDLVEEFGEERVRKVVKEVRARQKKEMKDYCGALFEIIQIFQDRELTYDQAGDVMCMAAELLSGCRHPVTGKIEFFSKEEA